jgi:hypothetical protein
MSFPSSLSLWAGMPSPHWFLTEPARLRVESISFFLLVFLLCAGLVVVIWNTLRRDFPSLPRLGIRGGLLLTVLWGLLFVLVLTMISGARELLTPGAWKQRGATYTLTPAPAPVPEITEAVRRQKLDDLRFALWDHARRHGGEFPAAPTQADFPADLWKLPGPSGAQYLYNAPRPAKEPLPLAYEPEVFGGPRLVLFSNGDIRALDSDALALALKGGS